MSRANRRLDERIIGLEQGKPSPFSDNRCKDRPPLSGGLGIGPIIIVRAKPFGLEGSTNQAVASNESSQSCSAETARSFSKARSWI